MRKIIALISLILLITGVYAQNVFKAQIKDGETKEALVGSSAFLKGTSIGSSTDINGRIVLNDIPAGKQTIVFSFVGYEKQELSIVFPMTDNSEKIIFLSPEAQGMEEVLVSATRSSRSISDIPTRIETIVSGELEEKNTMQPANVKMILTESTGVQTQQTSATSANASVRIQGLDGKYTQLLKDGFPLYSGFSGGLSLVQIPPLDLKRVELIKGASSTLYGGGAIAGLINFVTKEPTNNKELTFLVNGNLSKAADINGFYSQKFKKIGITIFASQNLQAAYDANKDDLSDIPNFKRYSLNPRIFYYIDETSTLSLGVNSSFEDRLGGDMQLINIKADNVHSYFEKNNSKRISTQLKFEKNFTDKSILTFKNSIGNFDRDITKSDYYFSGKQVSSFSELSYLFNRKSSEWILGANLWTDNFKQNNFTLYPLNSNAAVGGVFLQNNFIVNHKIILETGLRADATSQNEFFILPKISLLYKISPKFSSRIGGGMGYKTPTIFSEEVEERGFRDVQPIDLNSVKSEKSIGGNIDFNYRTTFFEKFIFSVNQLFFYTRLNQPLILNEYALPNGNYELNNASGYLDSKGSETNIKLKYDDFDLYCGYTFTDAVRHFSTETTNPLTAKHRIYSTLTYELDEKIRVGYELFYTGKQTLSNGETRPDYWIMGISAQYNFKHFSLFINAENFSDTRQTKFESIYTGSLQNPQFREIWAPTDGFLFNAGFKVNVW